MNQYQILNIAGMLTTPLAPASSIGLEAYQAMIEQTAPAWIAVVTGVGSAVGLEIVAALAGHTAITLQRANDDRWRVAAAVVVVYVLVGIIHLGLSIGGFMFLIAGLFWMVVALRHDAEQQVAISAEIESSDRTAQIESAERDSQRQHELKLNEQRLAHEREMAKLAAAKTAAKSGELATVSPEKSAANVGKLPQRWNAVPLEMYGEIAQMSAGEIAAKFKLKSARTARDWRRRAVAAVGLD